MTKTAELDRLFKEWEQNIPEYQRKFVSDGIINEELYNKANKKILFIAKDPDDPDQKESWDFRELWNQEFKNTFTHRLAEWAYGVLNDFPDYKTVCNDRPKLICALQSIAFMNVKKIGGRSEADRNEIFEHTKRNKNFLLNEIEIIKPEIVILCLSWWQDTIDFLFDSILWNEPVEPFNYKAFGKWNNSKIISFYHSSQYTYSAAFLYSVLQKIIESRNFIEL